MNHKKGNGFTVRAWVMLMMLRLLLMMMSVYCMTAWTSLHLHLILFICCKGEAWANSILVMKVEQSLFVYLPVSHSLSPCSVICLTICLFYFSTFLNLPLLVFFLFSIFPIIVSTTPPKTNMEPENHPPNLLWGPSASPKQCLLPATPSSTTGGSGGRHWPRHCRGWLQHFHQKLTLI